LARSGVARECGRRHHRAPGRDQLKGVSQSSNSNGDVLLKHSGDTKDFFTMCVGTPATKTQGIYFFLNCADFTSNEFASVDTANGVLTTLPGVSGGVTFDTANEMVVTKVKTLKTIVMPFSLEFGCGVEGFEAQQGIVEITYSLDGASICPDSMKFAFDGLGNLDGDFSLILPGASIVAKPRSKTINAFPPALP
jgi:hypothetical protein